jgi:tetratricopeptide (TPR) repeat protein
MTPKQSDPRLAEAREAFVKGERQRAFALYDAILQQSPDDLRALLDAGAAYFATFENFEEAARLFERVIQLAPDSIEARLWLADVSSYGYAGGYDAAARLYRSALQDARQPDDIADAAVGLFTSTRAPGQPTPLADALAALRHAREVAPDRPDLALALGYALFANGETEAAQAALRESQALYQRQQSKQAGIPQRALEQIAQTGKLTKSTMVINSPRQARWLKQA